MVEAPAAQPPLALPMGELSSEARLRGRRQWQVWKMNRDCDRVPSQSRLRRASSPIGGAKGRAMPAQRPEIFAQLIRRHHPYARKNFEPAFLPLPNCGVLPFDPTSP